MVIVDVNKLDKELEARGLHFTRYADDTIIKCGYSHGEARGLANCRRGYMFVAHSKILQNAITKLALSKPNKKKGRQGVSLRLRLLFSLKLNL